MEKLFKSKIAFGVFVILFTTLLLIVYKDPFARIVWCLSVGGLTGFVLAQWYWIDKMGKIQHLIDARMASPETAELLKEKEIELLKFKKHNENLVAHILDLQNTLKAQEDEIVLLKESNETLLREREYIQKTSQEMRDRLYAPESKEKGLTDELKEFIGEN